MEKPENFPIGLMDFFAIVLPGAILTFLACRLVPTTARSELFTPWPQIESGVPAWAAFAVVSYVIGHILHDAGSILDETYDAYFVKKYKRRKGDEPLLTRTREVMQEMLGSKWKMTNAFSWSGSYVRVHSASAARELERAGADSKFFRSLVLVLTISGPFLFAAGHPLGGVVAIILAGFSYWRFCKRRWDSSQLSYEYFILLRQEEADRAKAVPVAHAR